MSKSQLQLEIDAGASSSSSSSFSGSNITPSFPTSSLPISDISSPNLRKQPELIEEEPQIIVAETGPDVFHLRRKRWLTPSENGLVGRVSNTTPDTPQDCAARVRLDRLILEPEISDKTWAAGVNNVWNGLINGGRLKKPLPLEVVVKVLKAGWHRDGTWPKGLVVPPSPPIPPSSFDELEPLIEEEPVILPEAVALPLPMSIPASAVVQERLIRIEGADSTGYLSDTSRERLEQALEKCDGNLESLADEDIMRIKYDPWSSWKQTGQDENAIPL